MKAILALVLIYHVLAAPDWAEVEKKFKEIHDNEKAAVTKIGDFLHADPDTKAALSLEKILERCNEEIEAMYNKDFKPLIDEKRLSPGSVEHYPIYIHDIQNKHMAELKEQADKLTPENQKEVEKRFETLTKFREDKVKEIIQCLMA